MSAIFISHSSKDDAVAVELKSRLEDQGHRSVFLDFDPEDGIPAGRDWERELYARLRGCQAVIVLCSEDSMASRWCFAEIAFARSLGKALLPLKISDCTIPTAFKDVQAVDFRTDREAGYRRLWAGLRRAGIDPANMFDWDGGNPPYPGLMVFQEADAAVYFGRSAEVQATVEKLNRMQRLGDGQFAMILGASGSGKSSLLRAGILPRLKRDRDHWLVPEAFRPLGQPFDRLAMVLSAAFKAGGAERSWQDVRDRLIQPADSATAYLTALANDLRAVSGQSEAMLLLSIDQFEELLTTVEAEVESRFIEFLRALVEARTKSIIVIGTLRSDFLGSFQDHPALRGLAYEPLDLPQLPVEAFAEIIEGPARVAGLELEPGLAGAMVADTATEDALPLLAFALRELWEARSADGRLTIESYRNGLGGLQGAVAKAADGLFPKTFATRDQERDIRNAFLSMVRVDAAGAYIRKPARWSALPASAHGLLEKFVQGRLLVARGEGTDRILEVAHEALIRRWDKLRGWVDESRDFLRTRERIEAATARWLEAERDPSLLLPRGRPLAEAQEILTTRRADLAPETIECIEASIAAKRAQDDKEQRAQQERVDAARRLARRTAIAALVSSVLFVLAVGGGWYALQKADEAEKNADQLAQSNAQLEAEKTRAEKAAAAAEREARISDARGLAAQANSALLNNQIDRSLLFSIEAYRTYDDYDTRDSLLTALEHSPHLASFLRGHTSNPTVGGTGAYSVSFSPDGKTLASGGRDGQVILWDVARRRPARSPLATHLNDVGSVVIDPTGRIVASAGFDGLWLWDIETGAQIAQPEGILGPGFSGGVAAVAFSPDGRMLVFGGSDNLVKLWDVAAGKLIGQPLEGHAGWVTDVAVSPDGRLVASSSCRKTEEDVCVQGEIRLWDVETYQPIRQPIIAPGGTVTSLAFTPDGAILASGGDNNAIRLWSVADGEQIGQPLTGHTGRVNSVALDPDGRIVASASVDATVRLWDASTGVPIGEPLTGHGREVFDVAFSPDGEILASASDDNAIILWNVASRLPISTILRGEGSSSSTLTFSRDGRLLAAGGSDASVTLWNVDTGETMGRWLVADANSKEIKTATGTSFSAAHALVESVAFSRDGKILASGTLDGTIGFWNVPDGQPVGTSLHFPGEVRKLAFSPDGRLLASAGSGKIVLWDVATRKQADEPWGRHAEDVYGLDFSPDGRVVASGSFDGTVILWDVASGEPIGAPLTGHKEWVTDVAFGPDGHVLASADSEIILWNTKTRELIGQPLPSDSSYTKVAFSPDGAMLAASKGDHSLALWEIASQAPIVHPLIDPYTSGQIEGVAFSPIDPLVATALFDGPIVLWDVSLDSWQRLACRMANRNLTAAEWEKVAPSRPYRKTCPDLPAHPSAYQPALEQAVAKGFEAWQAGNKVQALADFTGGIDGVAAYRHEDGFVAPRQLVEAYVQRGVIYFVRREYDKAISDWEAAAEIAPQDPRAYSNLGFAYYELDRLDEAIKHWRTATRLDPESDDSWGGLGIALYDSGDTEQAIAAYGKALELYSGYGSPDWLRENRSWSEKSLRHVKELADLVTKTAHP